MDINVEKIMEEIRQEIKEKGYKKTDILFDDIPVANYQFKLGDEEDLENEIEYLNANHLHDVNMPIQSGNPVAKVVKNVIRKTVKFLFYPVLVFQNKFNASVVCTLNIFSLKLGIFEQQQQQIEELRRKLDELENILEYRDTEEE